MQDKHQKLDALAKQQQEFDKKRKMLAQDAFVAKLKLKHEQERQMLLLKQGKKVQTSEHMLSALKVPRRDSAPSGNWELETLISTLALCFCASGGRELGTLPSTRHGFGSAINNDVVRFFRSG